MKVNVNSRIYSFLTPTIFPLIEADLNLIDLDENVVNKHIFSFPDGLVLVF
jgi:hypothetical protein